MADTVDSNKDCGSALDCDAVLKVIPNLRRLAAAFAPDTDAADDAVEIVLRRTIDQQVHYSDGTKLRVGMFLLLYRVLESRVKPAWAFTDADRALPGDQNELCARLRKLPFDQRIALLLLVCEDFSYEQVAEITGAGVAAVRLRVSQAREGLRLVSSQTTEGPGIETACDDRVGGTECFLGRRVTS